MPFEKGREKTGGRLKGSVSAARRSPKFVEQLKGYSFNYPKELSEVLLELKDLRKALTAFPLTGDKQKDLVELERRNSLVRELQFFYGELKSLLPYMAPKLREKEVVVTETDETTSTASTKESISDEDLLKALGDGKKTDDNPRPSGPPVLGARDSELQVPASTDENLSDVAGEQEEDE